MPMPRLMLSTLIVCAAFGASAPALAAPYDHDMLIVAKPSAADQARWKASAKRVTIMRDKWGIPHVFGKSDADAVFGLMYAQAEDDFNRVERNYINAMGRLAEVEGEAEVWRDLRMKMYITPAAMKARYAASPAWLKRLMVSFADGLNYYLLTHPDVKPKLLTRFEPWMALTFSEGSIGGDIEEIDLKQLAAFYGKPRQPLALDGSVKLRTEPSGSNGFAIAPKLTANGHALLMINPHTSFYFRPEVHVVSDEGLNAYGAVTWGQFFIYQGFNERAGWMHTSGGGDVIDEYLETVVEKEGKFFYKFGKGLRAFKAVPITLPYKTADGMGSKTVTAYFSHRGPVVREASGKWVSVRMMEEPLKALTQSYTRTKARNHKDFSKTMALRTNSSNNTVYADADGNIALFHGNFLPRRDPKFDYTQPVDGSNPATDWQGLHTVAEIINVFNPATGWIQNTNNAPWNAAGASSPKQKDFPAYMWALPENARGVHAAKVLDGRKDFTLDSLIAAAYDNELTAFEEMLPQLFEAYDTLPGDDLYRRQLDQQINALRDWDLRATVDSVPTSLAVFWAQDMWDTHAKAAAAIRMPLMHYMRDKLSPQERLEALGRASAKLTANFGSWRTPWGEINRFQRVSGDIRQQYDDDKPSLPVPYASGNWGSLAAYGMSAKQTTRRIYGDRGNSFVAAVEFGPKVKARSILAGGNSGDPASKHFMDQAEMYARGEFKDVLFYKEDIEKNLERKYHPGE